MDAIVSADAAKSRRTYRKNKIKKIKTRLDEYHHLSLPDLRRGDIMNLKDELTKDIAVYDALQTRYELLSTDTATEPEKLEEEKNHDEVKAYHQDMLSTIDKLLSMVQAYDRGVSIKEDLIDLEGMFDNPRLFEQTFSRIQTKISDFREETNRYRDEPDMQAIHKDIRSSMNQISSDFAAAARSRDTTVGASPPAVSTTVYKEAKFDLDPPTFSGLPKEWRNFHIVFTNLIKTRGTHLTNTEKHLLLMKAMKSEEARKLVLLQASSDDPYEDSMKALINTFGSATIVYPFHIMEIFTRVPYSYSRDGLRKLRERCWINYQAVKRYDGCTLSQAVVAFACENFDPKLKEKWDEHCSGKEDLPTLEELMAFTEPLEYRMSSPHTNSSSNVPTTSIKSPMTEPPTAKRVAASNKPANRSICPLCKQAHSLSQCEAFLALSPEDRFKVAKEDKRCTNCLADSHATSRCSSPFTCRHCHNKHHSLLHKETQTTTANQSTIKVQIEKPTTMSEVSPPEFYFVDTAIVKAVSGSRQLPARVALDSGAGISLISENLATQLKLQRHPQHIIVEGAYGKASSKYFVEVTLQSLQDPTQSVDLKLSVIPKIKLFLQPDNREKILSNPLLKDLQLADPELGGPLDLLLGSVDRVECVSGLPIRDPESRIAATKTIFGWTVTGPLKEKNSAPLLQAMAIEDPLQDSLERLWKMDMMPETTQFSQADQATIDHFQSTHEVQPDGRYMVCLPRIPNPPPLGESRNQAVQRYLSNERSLSRKGQLHAFEQVLREYIELDHAECIPVEQLNRITDVYYLPTHGVFKDSSSTTKLRAVFDASAKTSSGSSLNDTLQVGPNLYPLLQDVLIKFRSYKIGMSADISKMFREILLHPNDRDLHRFVMRDTQNQIRDFRMKRVTFGVTTSPFLATQVIRQLALTHQVTHPQASQAILQDFYVDDFLAGAETTQEAVHLHQQLCNLLLLAKMKLRKWRTNDDELKKAINVDLLETQDLIINTPSNAPKALGVHWNVSQDNLHIATPPIEVKAKVTKRIVASECARIYDILGLFAPALISAKVLLQSLWKLPLSWDDEIPQDLQEKFAHWMETLPHVTEFPIPRRMICNDSPVVYRSLHGFADASSTAYGAAIYLRALHEDTSISIALVTSKARVLPVKPITIPKAELVAALLLAKLVIHVSEVLNVDREQIYTWTDSAIVLCWLKKDASTLKIFVANRIAAIQELIPSSQWRHVPSDQNPADLLSRGLDAKLLVQCKLWWQGPPWLSLQPTSWPDHQFHKPKLLPEAKVLVHTLQPGTPQYFWDCYSDFNHAVRILAWIKRFHRNSLKPRKTTATITPGESRQARLHLLRLSQQNTYPEVYSALQHGKTLPKGHPLYGFDIFLDKDSLLKVCSRVRNPKSSRQPRTLIPLSLKSTLTQLMLKTFHKMYSHPGIAALLSIIGETYYIIGLRNFLKKLSRECSICQRAYGQPFHQRMGLLPLQRTTPAPPFSHTGLDFAGPFLVKRGHTRKPVIDKTYACLFVCLTTKAIHLELCSSLSTPDFLAALKRFTARRGTPSHIFSDNGTNFLGAHHEIRELQKLLLSNQTVASISHFCTESTTQWHFIPPRAPHFGGLWEAGIKSMKTLLKKLVAPHPLRFDELYTILTEIEAILNSRPLIPLHSTDADTPSLSPGHFLIGRPLKSPPTSVASHAKISSLRRWALVNRLSQDLWKDWLHRYLQSLHHRTKWTSPEVSITVDDVVYVKDETLKYRDWPLARVIKIYPGSDGIVRAVDLLCHGKTIKRAIHRLIPLHFEDHSSSSASAPQYVRDFNSEQAGNGRKA